MPMMPNPITTYEEWCERFGRSANRADHEALWYLFTHGLFIGLLLSREHLRHFFDIGIGQSELIADALLTLDMGALDMLLTTRYTGTVSDTDRTHIAEDLLRLLSEADVPY